MKITDLKEGQHINHPRKGNGIVQKLTARTIKVKYYGVTTTVTLNSKNTDFNIGDL